MPTIGEGQIVPADDANEEHPHYRYQREASNVNKFMVICDEGWRSSIVCTGMYEWAAIWLVETLQGKPFAKGWRP